MILETLQNPFEIRGGAAMVTVDNHVYLFGGASPNQESFNDMWILKISDNNNINNNIENWVKIETTGDIPTPRSGHAMVVYKQHILLYGGINFAEEIAFNDLYCLDLGTLIWSYVGESGEELQPRNSHTFAVLTDQDISYLVVYGGANPETGPLSETFIALLPPSIQVGFFVNWEKMTESPHNYPASRELHSSSVCKNHLLICGGKNNQEIVGDCWTLSFSCQIERPELDKSIYNFESSNGHSFQWKHMIELDQENICAHVTVMTDNFDIYLYGGFNGQGVSNMLHKCSVASNIASTNSDSIEVNDISWDEVTLTVPAPLPRFGHCAVYCKVEEKPMMIVTGGITVNDDNTSNDSVIFTLT